MSWSKGNASEYQQDLDVYSYNHSSTSINHSRNDDSNAHGHYSASGHSFHSAQTPISQNADSYSTQVIQESTPTIQKQYKAFFIPVIVVVTCCILFIVTMYKNDCPKHENSLKNGCVLRFLGRFSFEDLSINPLFGPSSNTLLNMGALQADKVKHHGEGWRLFTCMWLHAGVFHLLSNIFGLFYIGVHLEKEFGPLKIAVVYLLSGFGGSLLSCLFLTYQVGVGASGALFGLVGATLSELIVNWGMYSNRLAALLSLFFLIGINFLLGLMPFVDNFAHIGGFLAGLLLGFVVLIKHQFGYVQQQLYPEAVMEGGRKYTKYSIFQVVAAVVSTAVLVISYVFTIIWVFSGKDGNKSCQWCRKLDCIDTRYWDCSTTGAKNVVCQKAQYTNGTGFITCSDNRSFFYSNLSDYTSAQLQSLCSNKCG